MYSIIIKAQMLFIYFDSYKFTFSFSVAEPFVYFSHCIYTIPCNSVPCKMDTREKFTEEVTTYPISHCVAESVPWKSGF